MNEFNIKEVDFFGLDIDKYLSFLLDKYESFGNIQNMPFIKRVLNNYSARLFFLNKHYFRTRGEFAPDNIQEAYNKRITEYKKELKRFEGLYLELPIFESVKAKIRNGEYTPYDEEGVEGINIDVSNLFFWFSSGQYDSRRNCKIEECEAGYSRSPLQKKQYFQKELDKILEGYEFVYLPYILDGQFIYDLDNGTNALNFANEIDMINYVIYLNEQIRGEVQKFPLTKPLKWTGDINILVTLFDELLKCGLIGNDRGAKENIKRLLLTNFINADGGDLSKDYLDEILKPSKMKKDKETADLLNGILSKLSKNSPQS
ncbi:hypothetical protein BPO_1091 [Bergeyella porcorum]|uniref:RteC protein n=1 Tax=Bergeyella porcorum TaxID=1735111 RepID=A0AAU0F4N0_9FLAO